MPANTLGTTRLDLWYVDYAKKETMLSKSCSSFHTNAPYRTLEKKIKTENKILSGGHCYIYFKDEETEAQKVTQFVSSKGEILT